MPSTRPRMGSKLLVAAAIATLGLASTPLFAAKKGDPEADARIQAMTVELTQLGEKDELRAATAERGQAQALIDKARSIVGERKQREALARALDELEATVALAGGKIVEAEKQKALDEQKQNLANLQQEVQQVRSDVATLEKEQAELEAKLGGGK